jgi:hypothetical protein
MHWHCTQCTVHMFGRISPQVTKVSLVAISGPKIVSIFSAHPSLSMALKMYLPASTLLRPTPYLQLSESVQIILRTFIAEYWRIFRLIIWFIRGDQRRLLYKPEKPPFSHLFTCKGNIEYTGCGNTERRLKYCPDCHLAHLSLRKGAG